MWIPFTVHIKVVPERGRRFDYVRSMQNIAQMVYDQLITQSDLQLATPGGGNTREYGGFGAFALGTAVKPQFGQTPAQLMITGHYSVDRENIQTQPAKTVLSSGEAVDGYGENKSLNNPVSTIDDEVATLRDLLDTQVAAALPDDIDYSIFRLDYQNIVYGDRGYHFPRS